MGKSLDEEIKETAYRLWRENGRSCDKVAKILADRGHKVSRQTIDAWKTERDWENRAARADAAERAAADGKANATEKMLLSLSASQQRYELYFESLGPVGVDNQAQYAYNNLCETITNIRKKLDEKPDLFRMTPFVMEAFVGFVKNNVKEPAAQEQVFGLIDRFFDEVKPDGD